MARVRARNLGILLTGVWLVLTGLSGLATIQLPGFGVLMALLALLAGIFLLAGR